jgi:beta-glucosidase-like glycosyl hydrolase
MQQHPSDSEPTSPAPPARTRRQLLATAGAVSATGAAAALSTPHASARSARPADTRSPSPATPSPSSDFGRTAHALLRRMSLREKIGQLFVVEVYGRSADAEHSRNRQLYGVATPAEVIAKYQPGGVIYFDTGRGNDNVHDPRQVARLSNGLQRASLHTGARLPLLVSIDQEGGSVVRRLIEPVTQLPGNMALAAGRSRADTFRSAEIIGSELAAMGINQNYAPVADVNVNPANPIIGVRSFGSDPSLCAALVGQTVRGYHSAQVASAAQHFPGHGDTDTDSHTGLPVIGHTREELDRIDLPPFRTAIARGVDTIMTAHIVVASLDPSKVPATMSHRIVTGLLREELGFRGLIVTDALDMGGATEDFPPDIAPVRALQAGCDQLVLAPRSDTAYAAVLSAVRSGKITESRVDASVQRILEHKLRHGLFARPYVSEARAPHTVGSRRNTGDAARITDRTITLIRNEHGTLPLTGDSRSVLVTGWGTTHLAMLARTIGERAGQRATALETGTAPDSARIDRATAAARDHDVTIVLTNTAAATHDRGAAQADLVKALSQTGTSVIAVAVRTPYDLNRFPSVPACLATYSYGAPSLTSLVHVLYGDVAPAGKLPAAIPHANSPANEGSSLYPYGHGLTYSST